MTKLNSSDGFLSNIYDGVKKKTSKLFHSPYSKFNISWLNEKYFKHAVNGKEYVHAYSNDIKVKFTDPKAFLLSVSELFINEIYKFNSANPSPYILDCGAHIGMSILYFKTLYPQAKIIAFEPDEHNYNLLKDNTSNWNFENVVLVNKAIWVENGEVLFNEANDMSSNIVEKTSTVEGKVKRIPSVRLKDYLIEKVDFLKIDIEGAEYSVLKDIEDSLSNVELMFLEYHGNFEQNNELVEIFEILQKNGFSFYIKEEGNIYDQPFYEAKQNLKKKYDIQLNIFCFRQ
jgi:FkbM family methyltransferase